jgi:uncharacterized protein (TIGR03118 family)
MKNMISKGAMACLAVTVSFIGMAGCKKNDTPPDLPTSHQSFTVVNLVASDATITAGRVDPHLLNGWGLAFSATGTAWISSPGDHTSLVYNGTGAQVLAPVTIPGHNATTGGIPTGQVFNNSTGFKIPGGAASRFIFAGIDGVISGWASGAAAVTLVDRNATSVYTGLTLGITGTDTLLYAADFNSKKIDVFDRNMAIRTMSFTDPSLPAGYAPFNIQNINGLLYVTYAQPDPVTHTEKKGVGLGVVSVFGTDGNFMRRFATGGDLNAPWGVAQAPDGWLTGTTGTVLVGNFGDGFINAFDQNGNSLGALQTNGARLVVEGVWGISFAPATATTVDPNRLYFAAGPGGGAKGSFGYVTK